MSIICVLIVFISLQYASMGVGPHVKKELLVGFCCPLIGLSYPWFLLLSQPPCELFPPLCPLLLLLNWFWFCRCWLAYPCWLLLLFPETNLFSIFDGCIYRPNFLSQYCLLSVYVCVYIVQILTEFERLWLVKNKVM